MRKFLLPVAGLALLAAANSAVAASSTANFNVKVQVNAACTVSAADLNFGTFSGSIPAGTTGTTAALVTCNKGVSYALSLAAGSGPLGTTATGAVIATMANGSNTIPAALTVSTVSPPATGGSDSTTINGTIVAAVTTPVAGTYTVAQAIYVLY